jgi:hypothetical protein
LQNFAGFVVLLPKNDSHLSTNPRLLQELLMTIWARKGNSFEVEFRVPSDCLGVRRETKEFLVPD